MGSCNRWAYSLDCVLGISSAGSELNDCDELDFDQNLEGIGRTDDAASLAQAALAVSKRARWG